MSKLPNKSLNLLKISSKKNIDLNVPFFISVKVNNYKNNKEFYLNKIKKLFKKKLIIIRSASFDEDKNQYTNAGKYLSINNISTKFNFLIEENIKQVISFLNNEDYFIIQDYIADVDCAGVLFSYNSLDESPYIKINYDNSGQTDKITSGVESKNYIQTIYKYHYVNTNEKFYTLIKNLPKIKNITKLKEIDIEFAIKKNKLFIFQVRNLFIKKNQKIKIDESLKNLEIKINNLRIENPTLFGEKTIFSNMADWNPAEIIGTKPKPMAISLYKELITDNIWSESRASLGYKDINHNRLLLNLGGSPYIDVRTDLNSFLPKDLNDKISKKIINNAIKYLEKNKNLHDQIEFKIIPTCYFFTKTKEELFNHLKLNKLDKITYKKELKKLTKSIIQKSIKRNNDDINKIDIQIKNIKKRNIHFINKIYFLNNLCKKYTLEFASVARESFISKFLSQNLFLNQLISQNIFDNICNSISTVTGNLLRDKNLLSKNNFIKKYGHLRPNTYSISSKNYKDAYDKYFSNRNDYKNHLSRKTKFKISKIESEKINIFLRKELNITFDEFIEFTKLSIINREYYKFQFSKIINEIFNQIKLFGKKINIKDNDLEYINYQTILNAYYDVDLNKFKGIIQREIQENKYKSQVLKRINLPDVITNPMDIYNFTEENKNGFFITEKKVLGKLVFLKDVNKLKYESIEGKILAIENADPGFDFIFNKKIAGLITKYGGANSHMSIRCNELMIPACIGVGNNIFSQIISYIKLELDCAQRSINKV